MVVRWARVGGFGWWWWARAGWWVGGGVRWVVVMVVVGGDGGGDGGWWVEGGGRNCCGFCGHPQLPLNNLSPCHNSKICCQLLSPAPKMQNRENFSHF